MADKGKAKSTPGEERFVSSGKSVTLLKPGKGAANTDKPKSAAKKGKK